MNRILFLFVTILLATAATAQDTLPKFTVRNVGSNRVIIGWVNTFPVTKQISVQRSHDSLKNYKTIMSVTDPAAIQNGFADTKAPNDHMFYRLFVNLDKGEFFFTNPQKPSWDTAQTVNTVIEKVMDTMKQITKPPVIPKPSFVPSFYVYTNKDGYVFINLPDAAEKKYRVKFFEEDDSFLFEVHVNEPALTLDKSNFIHAGWFKFELYKEEKLLEKHKFYLSKEF